MSFCLYVKVAEALVRRELRLRLKCIVPRFVDRDIASPMPRDASASIRVSPRAVGLFGFRSSAIVAPARLAREICAASIRMAYSFPRVCDRSGYV